jgi:hypothetical protein
MQKKRPGTNTGALTHSVEQNERSLALTETLPRDQNSNVFVICQLKPSRIV